MRKDDDVKPMVCPMCDLCSKYSEEWDAHYCAHCNEWLEGNNCVKPVNPKDERNVCWFHCWDRPKRPLQIIS